MDAKPEREWRPVPLPGYANDYQVSNLGEVRSLKNGHKHMMSLKHNKRSGYMYVILGYNGDSITRSVHRLVAGAFIPNPDNKPQINHINEVKTDNRVENLEWVTTHENNEHSKHKRYKQLELCSADGELLATFTSGRALAEVLGVSKATVAETARGNRSSCLGFQINYKEVG